MLGDCSKWEVKDSSNIEGKRCWSFVKRKQNWEVLYWSLYTSIEVVAYILEQMY